MYSQFQLVVMKEEKCIRTLVLWQNCLQGVPLLSESDCKWCPFFCLETMTRTKNECKYHTKLLGYSSCLIFKSNNSKVLMKMKNTRMV